MGAGIAASPHCAERRICRCSQLWPAPVKVETRPRSWLTSSGVASLRHHQSPGALHPAMLGGPSWDNHFCVPLRPIRSEKRFGPRRAKGRSSLPAPLPASPDRTRRFFPLPAGGDRFLGHLPRLPAVAGLPERLGPLPRSPVDNAPRRESRKAKKLCSSLWITGISGTTVGTFPRLLESGPATTSFKCLNPLH